MELLYIYIEKYGIFKEREFVFNKNYNIIFKNDELAITKTQELIKIHSEIISNINLVIGKNGAGKSCLIELIGDIFLSNSDTRDNGRLGKYIAITLEDSKLNVFYSSMTNLKITKSSLPCKLINLCNETQVDLYNCNILKISNSISFNNGFNEVWKTPVELFDIIEHDLSQQGYMSTVNKIECYIQEIFDDINKNVNSPFSKIMNEMNIESLTDRGKYILFNTETWDINRNSEVWSVIIKVQSPNSLNTI